MSTRRSDVSGLDLGIFLISFSILLIELLLTRIFSVTMFHHLSFLAVSLAMMGLGLSGLILTLWPRRYEREDFARVAGVAAMTFAVTAALVVGVAFHLPIRLESSAETLRNAVLIFSLAVVPFVAGGLVVALILTHHTENANRLYGYDLLGAAAACLAFVPMTNLLGAPTAVLFAAVVGILGGRVLAGEGKPWVRNTCMALALLLAGGGALNSMTGFYDVHVAKGNRQPPTLLMRWNSFSRVEVNGTAQSLIQPRPPMAYGYSSTLEGMTAREVYLRYDADALTQITGFDGDLGSVPHLGYDVTSAPYHMRRHGKVLVIGAGGGRDVLTALSLGSGPVTGVEVNPLTIELMQGPLDDFVGKLFSDYPGVDIVRDDARNFIRHTDERFEVIQASLIDTWAASSAGAYALAENSIYTVEAFEDYLDRLSPDGVVSFSRWYVEPPAEVLRVVVLAAEALRRDGVTDPSAHLFVVRTRTELTGNPSLATILMKRSPLTPGDLENLTAWADRMEFAVAYAPGGQAGAHAEPAFARLLGGDAAGLMATAPYDLSPVSDDRPFFFDRVPLSAWLRDRIGLPAPAYGAADLTLGGQTLLAALLTTLGFTAVLIMMPLLKTRRQAADGGASRSLPWVVYFTGLGLGYIVVEIVTIQRLNLYLGNPTYALTVVLFSMLAASGVGSMVAGRWVSRSSLPIVLVAVCVTLLGYHFLLPLGIDATLGASQPVRVMTAIAMIAPVAFLMGMPFPSGLRYAGRISTTLVSWAWAVNAGASVSGAVLAVVVSMGAGFSAAMWFGIAAYGTALGALALATVPASKLAAAEWREPAIDSRPGLPRAHFPPH